MSKGSVVVGAPAGELHALPTSIAADIFRAAGFEVLDLGANLPAESFAAIATEQPRLVAVGMSVTSPGQGEIVRATIAAIREANDVPVLLGGPGIADADEAAELGADFYAAKATDALPWLEALVNR